MRELGEILERVRALRAGGDGAALATIVHVEGSSYRREGARMLLEADGRATGVLSGGCLEADLATAAAAARAERAPRVVVYDLRAEEEAIWGFGLGCEGRVTLLVEPLDADGLERLDHELATILERRIELRTATVFEATGADARLGERLALAGEGGEGTEETKEPSEGRDQGRAGASPELRDAPDIRSWRSEARTLLVTLAPGEARAARLEDPDRTGSISILVESLLPPPHLLVLGGERDVAPLLRLGRELGWETTVVVARRPSPAEAARLAAHARLVVAAPRELREAGVELTSRTAAVVATHRYLDDLAYLAELATETAPSSRPSSSPASSSLRSSPPVSAPSSRPGYLAVLGPARRRSRLLADLDRLGHRLDAEPLASLRGPAGLALGGRSPGEVALSIVAEIQAALAGGSVRPLSEPADGATEPIADRLRVP